jgi:hypothetical protein
LVELRMVAHQRTGLGEKRSFVLAPK